MTDHAILEPELDDQVVEVLPARETLWLNINVAPVIGVNMAIAVNAFSTHSVAAANAQQWLGTFQR
ncbi:hypothetical protein [Georgenia ruanii]|uniref:hypothetical protein n=1 Tax=Georgenia ruanii TaxID=348442 RepID=UPI0012644404|nr:hypothetical protein [Georgenia ruanii]